MSKGNTFENDYLKLVFHGTPIANIADNAATSPLTAYRMALHNAYPGEAGSQNTNELSYGGYARPSISRNSGGFTITNNNVINAAEISFGQKTSGSDESAFYWSLGTDAAGAGKILYMGLLSPSSLGAFTGATNDNITCPGHGLSVDDRVAFFPINGEALPTGITEGTVYWVKAVSGDTFTLSTTQGGATLDITAAGSGAAYKAQPLQVSNTIEPKFAAGAWSLFED